jgi:hypothetical protein
MIKYPSIEQFRRIVSEVRLKADFKGLDENNKPVYKRSDVYPTLKFYGAIKAHGTNAAIVKHKDKIQFQSRTRVLSLEHDNEGFMNYMSNIDLEPLFNGLEFNDHVAIYGEWCGGNIQKGVALNQLPKMFIIFGVKIDGEWVKFSPLLQDVKNNIHNIYKFKTFEIDIDFNYPEKSQNQMLEWTLEVENECPIGKYFGVYGIGEGIVFTNYQNQDLKFKSKGQKHSVSKVKTLNAVDVELIKSVNEFVETVVTENRCSQGLSHFKENNIEVDITNVGVFIGWVVSDVLKEEMDVIQASKLDLKMVKKETSIQAKAWFINNLEF